MAAEQPSLLAPNRVTPDATSTEREEEFDMSEIDRQRISAVKAMEALGYTFNGIEWNASGRGTTAAPALLDEADAMHALLVLRADKIEGSTEFEEKTEFAMLCEVIEAYEAKRWADGKAPGGKG